MKNVGINSKINESKNKKKFHNCEPNIYVSKQIFILAWKLVVAKRTFFPVSCLIIGRLVKTEAIIQIYFAAPRMINLFGLTNIINYLRNNLNEQKFLSFFWTTKSGKFLARHSNIENMVPCNIWLWLDHSHLKYSKLRFNARFRESGRRFSTCFIHLCIILHPSKKTINFSLIWLTKLNIGRLAWLFHYYKFFSMAQENPEYSNRLFSMEYEEWKCYRFLILILKKK